MPQFGSLITDDSRVIIYNHNVFIQQSTGHLILAWTAEFPRTGKANRISPYSSALGRSRCACGLQSLNANINIGNDIICKFCKLV